VHGIRDRFIIPLGLMSAHSPAWVALAVYIGLGVVFGILGFTVAQFGTAPQSHRRGSGDGWPPAA
jgi:hypothetical protein